MNENTDPNNHEVKTGTVLPPEVKEELVREVIEVISYSGPFPPPEMLEKYERALPGSADRIFKMAEEQAHHRRKVESDILKSDIRDSKLGLWFGLIVALAGLGVAALSAYTGHEAAASIIGTGVLASLVGTFIYGSQKKEQEKKGPDLQEPQE
jgi:uncharacterized membrane protein